jgi:DNA-binding HxlR family transcriptional regulator
VSRNPCDASGKVGVESVLVGIVPTILPSERNRVVNEEANHALLQGALCAFNACFVDPRGTVDRECREHIDSGKEQHPVSDRKQEVLKRTIDASWAIVYLGILHHLMTRGVLRFNEIQRLKPTLSPRILTAQLRELEEDGVIVRKVYPVVPPKVEYSLSKAGESLKPLIKAM